MINFLLFNALAMTLFRGGELKANVVATVVATTSSYLMNRGWTFRHRKTNRIRREYVLFFVFNGVGLGIELAVMGIAKYGLGMSGLIALNVAKVLGIGLATIFRFWSYRTFVFSGAPAAAPTTPGASETPRASETPSAPSAQATVEPGEWVDDRPWPEPATAGRSRRSRP